MSRHRNVTFWQAFVAMTWFPVLAAIVSVYVWKSDQSSVFVHYVRQNLAITITGLFGAWVVATIVVIYLFRFIRRS